MNIRKDENQEKEFKEKIFREITKENPDKGIFFYDESRFGLMSQVGREWRGRGIKPIIPTIMKFEYRYLYKAVSPITGDSFSFVMPDMTTESLNLFLKEFSKYLGKREAIVVMDNASSHRIKSWKYLQTYR